MRKSFRMLGKRGLFLIIVIGISLVFAVTTNACRMWGIVSDVSQSTILEQQLTAFQAFGATNTDGWGIGYYFNGITQYPLTWPIVRRGGPPANTDPDYVLAMNEVIQQGAKTVIAHVRNATSGHTGIPDPHPFTEPGWMFCHNGTIDSATLVQLIGQDYLNQHQPDYTDPYIDSELYFIYIMKTIREWPYNIAITKDGVSSNETVYTDVEGAIKKAVATLDSALHHNGNIPPSQPQLTFLLTNGKKLWGCSYADVNQPYYTLHYSWPQPGNNWVVCSEPICGGTWYDIPMYHVITFEAGMRLVDTEIPHI